MYVPKSTTIFALRCALHPPLPPRCGRPLNTTADPTHPFHRQWCPGRHHLSSCITTKAVSVVSPNVVCLLPNSPWLLEKSSSAILFVLWFAYVLSDPPFVWGALLILRLATASLPTSVSALRNISKGSLQLVRLSTKYANSILYFLTLIIIIIEYLYNCWFDAGFSHSLVNSLRAGIMPAWLNSLPSASHNKYLPTECIMNGLDRSCGICYAYLYLCLKIGVSDVLGTWMLPTP